MNPLLSRTGSAEDLINHLAWPKRLMTMQQMQPASDSEGRAIAECAAWADRRRRVAADAAWRAMRGWARQIGIRRAIGLFALGRGWCRATAAVEFALTTPLLVILLGGAADYGLAQFYRTNLANAVAAGCQYAYLTGTTVTAANIQTVIKNAMFLPAGADANLSISITGPKGYCVTGSGPTMSSVTPGSVCTVDGSIAGTYVLITATYTSPGLMNGFLASATQVMSEAATVRLN
jgi:Flp pilus assembly protein TadG